MYTFSFHPKDLVSNVQSRFTGGDVYLVLSIKANSQHGCSLVFEALKNIFLDFVSKLVCCVAQSHNEQSDCQGLIL